MRALVLPLTVLLALSSGCSKPPDRKAFDQAWTAAAAAKDGQAAWRLLDQASRARIVDGLARSQARAATDDRWRALVVAVNEPIDVAQAPEALAVALLTGQLGQGGLAVDATSPHVHLEGGAWRLRVEPVGFTTDGIPATLTVRLPTADLAPPATTRMQIQVERDDRFTGQPRTGAQMVAAYREAAAAVAKAAAVPDPFVDGATRLMMHHHFGGTGAVGSPEFVFDPLTVMTPRIPIYDTQVHRVVYREDPRLVYGAWPAPK